MSKKQDRKIILMFILVGIVLFVIIGFLTYNVFFKDHSHNKKLVSLDLYGYTLSENDISLYKTNFKGLEKILNETPINYQEYAKNLSKLFIIDVFTLNNKITSTDIGGLEFIHKELRENFIENMGNTLYKNIKSNLDGKRKQNLPEVESIEVTNIFETKYTYNENEYEAYLITLKWTYTKNNNYQKSIKLTLIKDNDILYIVKGE